MDITNNSTSNKLEIRQLTLGKQDYPQSKEEEVLEIEVQDMDFYKDTTLVVVKEKKHFKQISFKYIFQSLFYAIQWSQLKRQISKEAIGGVLHRHWIKGSLGITAVLLVWFSWGLEEKNSTAAILPSYAVSTSISASLISNNDNNKTNSEGMLALSSEAKANYIARFKDVAQAEMQKFGIPASVTLGLAILYSNYGVSSLAQVGHNHFHINCNNNPLAEGISGREMYEDICYVHYQNAWTGFRANSMELSGKLYQELHKIAKNDYKVWVSGLQKFAYPQTDKLLEVIEEHQLYLFDEIKKDKSKQ